MTSPAPRRLSLAVAALAIPALLAACTGGDGGASTPTAAVATPSPAPSAAASPDAQGGSSAPGGCPTAQPEALAADQTRTVTIATDSGDIELRIDGSLSPIAAGNFVALAECGWYDGVVFHRLVPDFVIQGGDGQWGRSPSVDPNLVGTGGPGYTIEDEPVTTPYRRGTVAMARTADPNSVGSQFFIVLADGAAQALAAPEYNNYQIIGEVTSGMEAVDAIAAMPNSGPATGNAALEPVPMTKVTVATP